MSTVFLFTPLMWAALGGLCWKNEAQVREKDMQHGAHVALVSKGRGVSPEQG